MPPKTQLAEKQWFQRDKEDTDEGKNSKLAEYLDDLWNDLSIVRIERIEIGDTGWRLTYRE
jgi:hypothetical protein